MPFSETCNMSKDFCNMLLRHINKKIPFFAAGNIAFKKSNDHETSIELINRIFFVYNRNCSISQVSRL